MSNFNLKLSVVIPCFNESQNIHELHKRVSEVCKSVVGQEYEIVLVNDGSKDNSWQIICEIVKKDTRLLAINLSRNYGHQIALTAGLELAKGDRILILDADLQDPPDLLPEMMYQMDLGADVVYGQRIARTGETVFKRTSAYLFYRLLNSLVDVTIPNDTGDFRLMSRKTLEVLNSMPEQHRFIRGMVSWIGLKQVPILYERAARYAGDTHYPLSKMMRFAIDAITSFSIKPLRIATYLGVFSCLVSMISIIYILINYFIGRSVEGWTSLALIVMALGSLQLIMIGVIGEYLGRLYIEAKGRPLYVIDEVVSSSISKSDQ
jgi:glycosyltransferase involved in cell wall biosynthesis